MHKQNKIRREKDACRVEESGYRAGDECRSPGMGVLCGLAAASGGGAAMTAVEALRKLMEENTNYVADKLTKQSAMLKHLVEIQKLTIVAAKYDLDDGMVSLL
jgi:hypothetical protein